MQYILFLRGINVGGRNKVEMAAFQARLGNLGFQNVQSYINSGNFLFEARQNREEAQEEIRKMLAGAYAFPIPFALIPGADYRKTVEALPEWWRDGSMARRDALFFSDGVSPEQAAQRIRAMKQYREAVCYTDIAVFWGKESEKEYGKTAYHKYLIREDFYKKVTIRNGNTVDKMAALLERA